MTPTEHYENEISVRLKTIETLQMEIKDLQKKKLELTDNVVLPLFGKTMAELELVKSYKTETGIGLEEDSYYFVSYGIKHHEFNVLYELKSDMIRELLQVPTDTVCDGDWLKKWKSTEAIYVDEYRHSKWKRKSM